MSRDGFTQHSIDSAPEAAREVLGEIESNLKTLPNAVRLYAESPLAVTMHLTGYKIIGELSCLTMTERVAVEMVAGVEHREPYSVAMYSSFGPVMGLSEAQVGAIRDGLPLDDARLEALRSATLALMRSRGALEDDELDTLLKSGLSRQDLFDILQVIARTVFTDYANRLTRPELDGFLESHRWVHPDER